MSNSHGQLRGATAGRPRGRELARATRVCTPRLVSALLLAALALGQVTAAAAQTQTPKSAVGSGAQTEPPARPAAVAGLPRPRSKPAPPVIAVVHRLRGWKLRAVVTPRDAPFAAAFDEKFVRVSVVAGYVLPDGRSVVARLPRAEAEMLNVSALFPKFYGSPARPDDSGLVLMKQDGTHSPVKFVGFDSATGLSLLEAAEPVLVAREAVYVAPVVGERVRLVAPLPAEVAEALSANEAEAAKGEAAANAADDQRPVGISGVLYMSLAEIEGRLTEIDRSPAGRAVALTLQVERAASPEWAGSVALTESGSLAGIVEQSSGRETRLLSAEVVGAAVKRVKERRASVPQPWLGARGDAVDGSPLEFFTQRGWPRTQAGELLRRRQGVMLTAVAPGSPAARAGLRPGDVISRIDNFEVRGVEDMSLLLRETGFDRLAEFTILRAHEQPRSLQVRLSETQNPALETARAEARAAETELRAAQAVVHRIDEDVRRTDELITTLDEMLRRAQAEERSAVSGVQRRQTARRIEELRRQLAELHSQLTGAESEFVRSRRQLEEANERLQAVSGAGVPMAFRPLLPFGVKAMLYMSSHVVAGREVPDHGLLVLDVDADSPAARAGLKAGDVIEAIDGERPHALDLSDKPPAELADEPSLAVRRSGQRFNVKLPRHER